MKRAVLFICAVVLWMVAGYAQQQDPGIELQNTTYPFPVQYYNLTEQKQALHMAYMDVKPTRSNGHTVLLLHGKNFSGSYWDSTATRLQQAGYRVIIPDQVGFGKSSKPTAFQYSFQLLALNTKNLLDSLKVDKVLVLGHSMGGMLATRFALMFPPRVEKLVLENPIGLEDYKAFVPYQSVDQLYASELKQDAAKMKAYQQDNYYGGNWKPAYDKWLALTTGWLSSKEYPTVAWNSALTSEMIITQPVGYEFEILAMPVLLIIGQRDRTALGKNLVSDSVRKQMGNYPVLGRQTAQRIKNATLVEIDNVGHLPHIEAFPLFIKPLLEFLAK